MVQQGTACPLSCVVSEIFYSILVSSIKMKLKEQAIKASI